VPNLAEIAEMAQMAQMAQVAVQPLESAMEDENGCHEEGASDEVDGVCC
tara:strand:- start:183 stop:329 length:147 start_codon:yes stop_codon:yes gene_type:complete